MQTQEPRQDAGATVSTAPAPPGDGHVIAAFDFSSLDRIPKSQMRVLHGLFETFVRTTALSLAGHLRVEVNPTLLSLEQVPYGEFVETLDASTTTAYASLRPFDGTMVVGLGRPLVFGAVELLLGGAPDAAAAPERRLTDLEKNLVQSLLRIILSDLREAWRAVAEIHFDVQALADDKNGPRVLTPREAVVVAAVEIKLGEVTSVMKLAMPSIFVKRLRDRLDRLQTVQRAASRREDQTRMAGLLKQVTLDFEVRMQGGLVSSREVAALKAGDVIRLDHPLDRPVDAYVNGQPMFIGQIGTSSDRLQYAIAKSLRME